MGRVDVAFSGARGIVDGVGKEIYRLEEFSFSVALEGHPSHESQKNLKYIAVCGKLDKTHLKNVSEKRG